LVDKLDGRRFVRVLVTAVHLEGVDPVLMDTLLRGKLVAQRKGEAANMWWTKNSAIPV